MPKIGVRRPEIALELYSRLPEVENCRDTAGDSLTPLYTLVAASMPLYTLVMASMPSYTCW